MLYKSNSGLRGQGRHLSETTAMGLKSLDLVDYQPAMTFHEIAAELGISHQMAHYIFTRAMAKLQKEYANAQSSIQNEQPQIP